MIEIPIGPATILIVTLAMTQAVVTLLTVWAAPAILIPLAVRVTAPTLIAFALIL